jgi:hypothetical protein
MKTIFQQLCDLKWLMMRVQVNTHSATSTLRVCRLCGAESRIPDTEQNVSAEIDKTVHDPSCLFKLLQEATIWVAGSHEWDNPATASQGIRFFPATALSSAAKAMVQSVSSYESWVDDDGTIYPDGRRLFMVMDLPIPAEVREEYEAEKIAGQRRVARINWERETEEVRRDRREALRVIKELNLGVVLEAQVREKLELAHPYPPEPTP